VAPARGARAASPGNAAAAGARYAIGLKHRLGFDDALDVVGAPGAGLNSV
jgi:hypothetical protein